MSNSVRPHRQQPNRLLCPWDSPGKSTGVGCHCLLRPKPPPLFKTEQCSPGNLRQYFRYGSQVLICLSPQNTLNCILCKEIRPLKCYGNTTSGWDRPQMTQWSPQSVIPLVTVGSYPEGQHALSALLSPKGVINYKRWHELCPWFYLQWAMTPSLKGKEPQLTGQCLYGW